jgi:hypothetical protein
VDGATGLTVQKYLLIIVQNYSLTRNWSVLSSLFRWMALVQQYSLTLAQKYLRTSKKVKILQNRSVLSSLLRWMAQLAY